jgi:hypothetical protein
MARVFICYRREDSSGYARLLFDKLEGCFGQSNVFMDSLPAGTDFVQTIEASVISCDVFLAVIGKNWLSTRDDEGQIRLQSPEDFVRLEIRTGLQKGIRVIPVLVGGARMHRSPELPEDIAPLARRNAFTLHDEGFRTRMESLLREVQVAAADAEEERQRPKSKDAEEGRQKQAEAAEERIDADIAPLHTEAANKSGALVGDEGLMVAPSTQQKQEREEAEPERIKRIMAGTDRSAEPLKVQRAHGDQLGPLRARPSLTGGAVIVSLAVTGAFLGYWLIHPRVPEPERGAQAGLTYSDLF